jgi:hypothetical protein
MAVFCSISQKNPYNNKSRTDCDAPPKNAGPYPQPKRIPAHPSPGSTDQPPGPNDGPKRRIGNQ